jgi:dienelactone hydrolase
MPISLKSAEPTPRDAITGEDPTDTSSELKFDVRIPSGTSTLEGVLSVPQGATGLVLFVHGSGSSRFSPRNQYVARFLHDAGIATLLFDLLTAEEESVDNRTRALRFDIELLSSRLLDATNWVRDRADIRHLKVGYFGASTGGGAALMAAARAGEDIRAIVSRGGRPDLAGALLAQVRSATLLIVGGMDHQVIELNVQAIARMNCEAQLRLVQGATHLFEEPGALEEVAKLAVDWFVQHLR